MSLTNFSPFAGAVGVSGAVENMPKGVKWTAEEHKHLAESWIEVSEDTNSIRVRGTNRDTTDFWEEILEKFRAKAPDDALSGSYGDRGAKALRSRWQDFVSKEVNSFNKALRKIYSSNPTGVTQNEMINMAVAIQVGDVNCLQCRERDRDPKTWEHHNCWLVLKGHRKFLPPSQTVREEEAEETAAASAVDENSISDGSITTNNNNNENIVGTGGTPRSSATGTTVEVDLRTFSSSSSYDKEQRKKKSRGGDGKNLTREKALDNFYKRQKLEELKKTDVVLQERQKDFSMFVTNQATAQVFAMCKYRYELAMKQGNDEKMNYWEKKMDEAMGLEEETNEE